MGASLLVENVAISALVLDDENVRVHSQRNLDVIAGSLQEFGQRKPIVVHGKVVIAGNGTLQAAKSLGWDSIDIVRLPEGWDAAKIKAFAIADNRSSELAAWDEEALLEVLQNFDESMLLATGFTDMDVRALESLYGEIPEGFEGRVNEPKPPPVGRLVTLHLDDETHDRWVEAWDMLDGDDSDRVNSILDALP